MVIYNALGLLMSPVFAGGRDCTSCISRPIGWAPIDGFTCREQCTTANAHTGRDEGTPVSI